ncbi:uncharacterized protein LOC123660860 isoform X2 [Melitaea cinxia]|uniref:uncharacterized protein LOC123660860 isoform X1 n=1 Tax=Melitaea cinxia TaxID=113334 RepID=UPI001E271D55|nr:uncharacterized protein LOC123660860 isoform X1 [Melitaea cinxia]XP_045451844.1 uncharacterized protein LOC123660860 isoform X2 [Melitaea cinxia]
MRCEIPEVGRCCFCFPLRLGLIVWGYLKLAASLVLLVVILMSFITNLQRQNYPHDILFLGSNIFYIGSLFADIVFHIIFAVGAHKKDPKKMELFLKFCIYTLVTYVLGLCYALYLTFSGYFFGFIFGLVIGTLFFSCIVIEIYIMILIRSEVVKLKRGSNFQFVNHSADANISVEIDVDNKTIY